MIRPSASEFALLKPLWSSGGLSAREIHNEVEAALEWSFSSTRKTLDRMVDKKLVRVEPLHGVKVYHAEAGKISVVAALTRDFMGRVLEIGDPVPAAALTAADSSARKRFSNSNRPCAKARTHDEPHRAVFSDVCRLDAGGLDSLCRWQPPC